MFQGTIPPPLRAHVLETARGWRATDVTVCCSGAFTIERTLATLDRFALHGNDVTLYSCALGAFGAGEELAVRVKPEHAEAWGWLDEYLRTPADTAATVALAGEMLKGLGKTNAYYRRVERAHVDGWPRLHEKTRAKLERKMVTLASFHAADAVDLVGEIPDGHAVASFPPFEAGGYEVMFRGLHEVFSWPEPAYDEMTEERKQLFLERVMRRREWLIGVRTPIEEWRKQLRGVVQERTLAVPIYVYSSAGPTRIALPRQQTAPVTVPRLERDDELGERMTVAPLTPPQFASLRSLYLNPRIQVAGADAVNGYAVLVDGKLAGAYAMTFHRPLTAGPKHMSLPQPEQFLMADFPVRPTRHKNLAKLILLAALSRESKLLAERIANKRAGSLVTAAFSQRPSSMKYRGLFQLLRRKEADPDAAHAWVLTYGAPMGGWTLDEALRTWKERYA